MDDCLNEKSGKELADGIAARAHVKLHECYQCGKCTAGCPMAHAMDVMPRELVHYMQLGMMEEILASKSIWLCASCHTCVERCPHSIDIPTLMELSRQAAKARGKIGVKTAEGFGLRRAKPEYDDVAAAAQRAGVPFSTVWEGTLARMKEGE